MRWWGICRRRSQPGCILALALLGTLALGGCSLGGASAAPPADAATVLQRVKDFSASDVNITIQMDGTTGGKAVSGGVTAQVMTNPERADMVYSITIDGQQYSFESIVDVATKTNYTYFTIPTALHTGKWLKQPTQPGGLDDIANFTNWNNMPDLAMVGPDNVLGVAVWHLHGTEASGGTQSQDDIYVSQADYRPVQAVLKTTGTDALTLTLTYTAFNSGLHIELPPPAQVQSA